MRRAMTLLAAIAILGSIEAGRTEAAFIITISQVGSDVLATGSGTITTNGLTPVVTINISLGIGPSTSLVTIGPSGTPVASIYNAFFSGPSNFGTGGITRPTSGTGGIGGFSFMDSQLAVSANYSSGSPILNSTSIFANSTFVSLGITQGAYVYSYAATRGGPTIDTFTLLIGNAAVPEPSSLALCGIAGAVGIGVTRNRRRRSLA